jgi:hypothetical protein
LVCLGNVICCNCCSRYGSVRYRHRTVFYSSHDVYQVLHQIRRVGPDPVTGWFSLFALSDSHVDQSFWSRHLRVWHWFWRFLICYFCTPEYSDSPTIHKECSAYRLFELARFKHGSSLALDVVFRIWPGTLSYRFCVG